MSLRAKTPTVFQMEMIECGAAALGIILGFYGRYVPLEQLRIDCNVTRDGSKASNIVSGAKKYGLASSGYQLTIDELMKLKPPFIVFWRYDHFLVVEGFNKDIVYINDPALGHYKISIKEFKINYSKIAFTFKRTKKFIPGGKQPYIFPQLIKRLKGQKRALCYIFLAGLAFTIAGLFIPLLGKVFVDYYLVENSKNIMKPILIGLLLTIVMRTSFSFLQNHYLIKLKNKLSLLFSMNFLWHLMALPIKFYSVRYTGDITNRMLLNESVARFITDTFIDGCINSILVILFASLLYYFNPFLMMITVLIGAINLITLQQIARLRRDKSLLLSYDLSNYYVNTYCGFKSIESIKVSGAEGRMYGRIVGSYIKAANAIHDLNKSTIFINSLPVLLNSLNAGLILVIGAVQVMNGELSVGTLVAIQSLAMSFMAPLNNLVDIAGSTQEMTGTIARLDDVLNYKIDPNIKLSDFSQDANLQLQKTKLCGSLELKNISFGYDPMEKPLLEDISLMVQPGEHIAIVGRSGAGKTTFSKLLTGLFKTWQGDVLIDNKSITEINRMILVNSLSLVEQEGTFFTGSVLDNITMWDTTIPFSDIMQATKDAGIHEELSSRNQGYHTSIYRQGSNFSGGQRQQIDIARALAVNPAILVLDEATCELDPVVESDIYNNIRRRGCTTIIIAHRLSTIRNADKILVLDKGKVVQAGVHEILIQQKGLYQDLIKAE